MISVITIDRVARSNVFFLVGRRIPVVRKRLMEHFSSKKTSESVSASFLEKISHSRWIACGTVCANRGEEGDSVYRLKVSNILYGDVDPSLQIFVERDRLNKTVRFGLRSQREVVVFSLSGEGEISGDDLILSVIHDPINNMRYIKIPVEFVKKDSLQKTISHYLKSRMNGEPSDENMTFDSQFVQFEELRIILGSIFRNRLCM